MVTLRRRTVGSRSYYYLQHSMRTRGGVRTVERYLGTRPPADLEGAKRAFLSQVYAARWLPALDAVKRGYDREQRDLPRSAAEKAERTFSVRFTYDTNRIEGSSLTLRETADLLERGLTPASRPLHDVLEAKSHERVFLDALGCTNELSLRLVLLWHRRLFEATKPDIAGRVRTHAVAISGSRFAPPSPVEVPVLLRELFRWYERSKRVLHPVELAALVHLKLVTVHPFSDGNGRMGRLLMNVVLHRHGFPLLDIPYEGRGGYYHALERAQTTGNEAIFVQWLFRRYVKEHRRYAGQRRAST